MSEFHTKTHLSQDDFCRNHPFKNNRCCGYEKPLTLLGSEKSGCCVPRDSRRRSKSSNFQCLFTQMDLGAAEDTVPLLDPPPTRWDPHTELHGYSKYILPLTRNCCSLKSSTLALRNSGRRPHTPEFWDIRFWFASKAFSGVWNGILDLGCPLTSSEVCSTEQDPCVRQ